MEPSGWAWWEGSPGLGTRGEPCKHRRGRSGAVAGSRAGDVVGAEENAVVLAPVVRHHVDHAILPLGPGAGHSQEEEEEGKRGGDPGTPSSSAPTAAAPVWQLPAAP